MAVLVCLSPPLLAQDPPEAYTEDFDSLWEFVRDYYAYFDRKQTDWQRARELYRPRAAQIRTRKEFIGLLEELLEELYDPHAHLGANTASSPRLIPSGIDLWAQWRDGRALITDVRARSEAERVGLRSRMEIRSIGGRPVATVIRERMPATLRAADPAAEDWALLVALAGDRGTPVRVEAASRGEFRAFTFYSAERQHSETMTASVLPGEIGYVRIHNALGDLALIPAFDSALTALRNTRGLILDLRDAPSGGNTTVARGIMSRLISEEQGYQRHELVAEERRHGVKRIWIERVAPRGPFTYKKPMVVLVARWTGSMGEGIAIGLDGMARATVIGTSMAGLVGATYQHTMRRTGFSATIPAERLYHVSGTPRELFKPEEIPDTGDADGDRWIQAALQRLRSQE